MRRALGPLLVLICGACISRDPVTSEADLVREVHELVDTRYALFGDKEVDWGAARAEALDALEDPSQDLEEVLIEMLDRLRDGHVNLATPTNVSIASSFLEDEVPTWDADLVQRHVLGFDYQQVGNVFWALPDPAWGYVRVDSFSSLPSRGTLDLAFADLSDAPTLVLDLRSNGGGSLEAAGRWVGRFVSRRFDAWHLQFTTGPAHDDLSEPEPRAVEPLAPGYEGPLAVLVDGRTYSAANVVAFGLATREDTVFVGAPTGGGAGSPVWHELSNGWELRFPTIRLSGPDQQAMELGHPVDVIAAPDPARPTQDAMIEAAVAALDAG